MTDTRLRELERKWKETGAVEDEAAYLLERVRAEVPPESTKDGSYAMQSTWNGTGATCAERYWRDLWMKRSLRQFTSLGRVLVLARFV